ncbi:MAG: hypothetical protein IT359_14970 [Gemmatimonadaceae bacterium]|nr:hypothetical protein [Gemmatimonadaceae bacterium]
MLMLIALLSVMAAGAITLVGTERRVVGNDAMATRAYALARGGLDRFLASRDSLGFTAVPPAPVESVRVAMNGGYADVIMERVRDEAGISTPAMYVVRSRGVLLDRAVRPRPVAERTLAQYARWQRAGMPVLAAHASLGGVDNQGSAGTLSGFDACGAAAAVAGVAVPTTPGYVQPHGAPFASGSPNLLDLGSAASAASAITIDWGGIVAKGIGAANVTLPGGAWPPSAQWGDATFWPVIVVRGDFVLPTDGRGLLVVTGTLTFPPLRQWDGVVLVGGAMVVPADATVNGAVVTGLNATIGGAVGVDQIAGRYVAQYNSCDVAHALSVFNGLTPLRNASIDRWAY